jgi:hypothetical protein
VTWKVEVVPAAFAARIVPEVAVPPSGFTTDKVTAAVPGSPMVHEVVIDVALATVAVPHVPSEDSVTVAPVWKPVPVMVKAFVAAGVAVTGETAVIVGAVSRVKPAGATAATFTTPPSLFVTV